MQPPRSNATIKAVNKGEEIHDKIASHILLQKHSVLDSALADMYAKSGVVSKVQ